MRRIKFQSLTGQGNISGKKILFIKPQTFMNLSGNAVADVVRFYKISLDRLLIIYDDAALPIGKIRIRKQGSGGGQKGMSDIIYKMGDDNIPRVRIGIGAPGDFIPIADFVLSKFSEKEKKAVFSAFDDVYHAALKIAEGDIETAMNRFN
jgi:PTH1 family peptidyl-tRNA hydrolase